MKTCKGDHRPIRSGSEKLLNSFSFYNCPLDTTLNPRLDSFICRPVSGVATESSKGPTASRVEKEHGVHVDETEVLLVKSGFVFITPQRI